MKIFINIPELFGRTKSDMEAERPLPSTSLLKEEAFDKGSTT